MEPSLSYTDNELDLEDEEAIPKNITTLKTEIRANASQKEVNEIVEEDFEEANRLIQNCSKLTVDIQRQYTLSQTATSSSSYGKDSDSGLPGCSTFNAGDSNTTIKQMMLKYNAHNKPNNSDKDPRPRSKMRYSQTTPKRTDVDPRPQLKTRYAQTTPIKCDRDRPSQSRMWYTTKIATKKSDKEPRPHSINDASANMSIHEKADSENMVERCLKQRKYILEDLVLDDSEGCNYATPSTSKLSAILTSDGMDDSSNTKSFLQENYNVDSDEESEDVSCICISAEGEDDSEAEDDHSIPENTNLSWTLQRKRLYEPPVSVENTPSKKLCSEMEQLTESNVENSCWRSNAQCSNFTLGSTDPPPELNLWLQRFSSWSKSQRIQAVDALISRSVATQRRHIMNVIEPLFQRDFISLLPKELALSVLGYLEPRDLLRAGQTCRYWRFLADDNLLWREQCRRVGIRTLKNKTRSMSFSDSPWKAAYMRLQAIESNWVTQPANELIIMKGHDDHVITCLQFHGNRIVSGSDDTTLKVWSAKTGRCLKTLEGHTGGVWSSQMNGHLVISGSTDRTLRVWNVKTGQCLKVLTGHTSTVRCMHLYKDRVVSGSRDTTLRVWSIPEGRCLRVLVGHLAAVRCVQYDGKVVVSGAYDYFVKIWNPDTGECLHTLAGHTNRVYSLQFDGVHVVSGSLDTSIRVWDVESGALKHTLIGHQSLTSGMELQSNTLVSGNADSTVKVWDISTGHCLHTLSGANKHQSAVTCLQSNRRFVITSSDDGTVKLWHLRTGQFIRNLVELGSGGSGGVVWRIRASDTKLVCAVGSRNGTEETKLLVLNFDIPSTCYKCTQ